MLVPQTSPTSRHQAYRLSSSTVSGDSCRKQAGRDPRQEQGRCGGLSGRDVQKDDRADVL